MTDRKLDRRTFLGASAVTAGAALGAGLLQKVAAQDYDPPGTHGQMSTMGDLRIDDFDPYTFLTDFDRGNVVGTNERGGAIREYDVVAVDKEVEIAPGVTFPAWVYGSRTAAHGHAGQVPGPTFRAEEGDTMRIRFRNRGTHPHTIHFHGMHTASMDGVPSTGPGMIHPGGEFTYEFPATPHGVHLYHCHSTPLKRHIHKGLYGAFIVDPPGGWGEPAENEFVMVMNGFDTNFDDENEVYALNSKAFAYAKRPISITNGKLQRLFLVNATEFDPINSFHLHANFFDYWDMGRKDNPKVFNDTIMQCQAQRGLIELRFDPEVHEPGRYMFHAHQSEFAELGWMSFFEVSA